jgi:hypothetical protein
VALVVRSWNLFHGNTVPPGRRAYLREMVELITADGPGIVCLQEVPVWALRELEGWCGMQSAGVVVRAPRVGSAEAGRRLTEIHHGLLRSAFTGEADAILVAPRFHVGDERSFFVNTSGLKRLLQGLRLDGGIYVWNFHTAGDDQFVTVADLVATHGGERAILAGDANLRPGEGRGYDLLEERGFSEPLAASIDQILVRGLSASAPARWPDDRRRLDGRLLSDHAPVELTIDDA